MGEGTAAGMTGMDLVSIVCCDLGGIVRGRSVPAARTGAAMRAGVGWVPANQSITPLGAIVDPNPFGSVGDLRLVPDERARARVGAAGGATAFELVLGGLVTTGGEPWECCPRAFLARALADLERETGARVVAAFEHEVQLVSDDRPAAPFSVDAQRRGEPFGSTVMAALEEAGVEPEMFLPEYGAHQFEIPAAPAPGLQAADRSVLLKEVVREVARRLGRRVTFTPLLDPEGVGNGAHIHFSLVDAGGRALLPDPGRPDSLSELGGRFAAGILRHARALTAFTAPSPVSMARLRPHHWSAGAACLGRQNRETLLRIPPVPPGSGAAAGCHLEFRGADSSANPHLALGAIVRAGLEGLRARLPAPPVLEGDPAELDEDGRARFAVDTLPDDLAGSLAALDADAVASRWLGRRMYDAYVGVKAAEVEATRDLDPATVCQRYASIY